MENMFGMAALVGWLAIAAAFPASAGAGEAIPQAELQALDRAIARELSSGNLGSQTLGDLTRLKHRLRKIQEAGGQVAAAPTATEGDDSLGQLLRRLEREAQAGGRAARRSLALYYVFLNEPEKALAQWRGMGRTNDYDIPYLLISSYLEMALGEYDAARKNMENASRFMESRVSLVLSKPVFCQTIGGYRVYAGRTGGDILPGEDTLLYVEVEGAEFHPVPGEGSGCDLMFGLKLKNEAQHVLWTDLNYGRYAPVFAGPIRDLHAALTWRVPNDLPPGQYYLHVEAVEESSKRRGESVLAFGVGKRDTNPERRVSGGMDPMMMRQIQEAQKAFPGADAPEGALGKWDPEFFNKQQFELMQKFYQNQKVE